ncbi:MULTISPECIES: DUF3048 domain-containing protein [Bacillus]|uniref:DUF3048 domain-containing protein n=1 Tax=Bacillus TaxID=1386 RepID=UPI000BAFB6F5|nr:DUF3048 domain-containing protein [Bacillus subtilis]ASZ60414.1 DUF3048 domain-containing protein [Bacillus subtilis]MEC1958207.1 DUF3048 domain-containing protein [Bacillus subtilis]MEC2234295.1 DUF3048 domain-containing protein [Bacillus subtilis]MED4865057.1 DUF3048 domain-containing protein [Bacillus subtilis]PLV36853.1 putative lipoprotein YerB precursor [Bacillus subtilis subsp. subtilis]
MKKWMTVCALCFVFFLLVSCQQKDAVPDTAKKLKAPLTGLKTEQKATERRPVAVVVNNHPKARPQSGLSKADIVIEALAEGQITRFLAIFQSQMPETVGPVRSAREYFVTLSNGFDSIFVHHGWSPGAKKQLESGAADYMNGLDFDGSLFWRADFSKPPHNSYTSYDYIKKAAEQKGYKLKQETNPLLFQTSDAKPANESYNVRVDYGTKNVTNLVEYNYDKKAKSYTRSSDGVITTDRETGKPVAMQNIFIVEASHHIIDQDGRRDIDLESGGKGLLFQHGNVIETDWKQVNGRIVPIKDGKWLPFVPGKTWINIVPDLDAASISKGEGV